MTARSHSRSRRKATRRSRKRILIHQASSSRTKRTSLRRRIASARAKREVERTVALLNQKRSK